MSREGHTKHEETIPPLLGRALDLHLRPAARLTWVGAGWAAICGIVAAGTLDFSANTAVRVLLTLVLADSVLGAAWTALSKIRDPFRGEPSDPEYRPVTPAAAGRVNPEPRMIEAPRPADRLGSEGQVAVEKLSLEPAPTSFWASIAAGLDARPALRSFDPSTGHLRQASFDKPFVKLRRGLRTSLRQAQEGPQDVASSGPSTGSGRCSGGASEGTSGRSKLRIGLRTLLGSGQAWWSDLSPTHRRRGLEVGLLFGFALLLGLALGKSVAVVVALGLLFPLVVWFALGRHPLRDGWTRAVLEIGLPWAIGLAAFTALPAMDLDGLSGLLLAVVFWARDHMPALAVGLLFVVGYYGKLTLDQPLRVIERQALMNVPQVVAVVLLAAWRQPILAGAAAILLLAQMLFQPYLRPYRVRWYLCSTQWMFMGVMLIAAMGVASSRF